MKIEFPSFKPLWFCRNGHLQTVLAVCWPTQLKTSPGEAHRIRTADDDVIVIRENTPAEWKLGDRIVILVHGLCGSHASQYMLRVAARLLDLGCKTIRVDMRGFGDSRWTSWGHMHAGKSDDVKSVLDDTRKRYPGSPLTLIGFSLGGNIGLKLLCEYGPAPPAELDSAVVVSPPIDLLKCTLNLGRGLNRFYDYYFAKLLAAAVVQRRKSGFRFADVPLQKFPKRLYDFDNQYTAPAAGFADAKDYYEQCSTYRRLDQIAVPTLLLVAEDDPIVPVEMYEGIDSPFITKLVAASGGHLGFISRKSGDQDRRWMDWRIADWVTKKGSGLFFSGGDRVSLEDAP